MKTAFASFCNSDVCKGCKLCVKGNKLVLFVGGKCSRNCWYCSLSKNRKNSPKAYANERPIKWKKDLIKEALESNAKGAGITGGDPLVYFRKTLKYAKALKKKFGEKFHTHIYLPLNLVNKRKIIKLHKYIDEVRFHPSFLIDPSKNEEEIEKIKNASEIFGRENTGIELPMMPDKKKEIYEFIRKLKGTIGFANLNELEISETNFKTITKKHSLNEDTYTIRGSVTAGKQIVEKAKKERLKIKVHLCTAKTKDSYQYINRLLNHNILPFGNKTDEGTVVYFAVYSKELKKDEVIIKKITPNYFVDRKNKRIIINMNDVLKVHEKTSLKIARVEEHPTYGQDRLEFGLIGE
jgi:pyruvate formate-lyase activating enzyme-like uncharacterized protein